MKEFLKPLSPTLESYYLVRCKAGDKQARCALIEHNLRLVAHVVKKYGTTLYDTEDLLSVGTIGLIKAIDSFDMNKGIHLATYASRCIDNEVLMMLRTDKKRALEVSLQDTIGVDKEGNEITLIDVIESSEEDIDKECILKEDVGILYKGFENKLSKREKEVISLRYGIKLHKDEGKTKVSFTKPKTQKQIASSMGISRSYVSRIEKKALGKLKKYFEEQEKCNDKN